MKNISLLLSALLVICNFAVFGQGVSINATGAPPDNSAMLDVSDTSRGTLITRMTATQINNISNPANGLMVFNLTTGCINYYYGGAWLQTCGSCPGANAANNGPICAGGALNLSVSTIPGATYSWSGPNGFSSTMQNPSIANATVAATGTYNCSVTVGSCGAIASTSATVDSISSFYSFSPLNPAPNQTVTFTPFDIGAGVTYSWTFTSGTPPASMAQSPTVTWSGDGTYATTLVASVAGCPSSQTTDSVTVCSPGSMTFNSNAGSVQTWTIPACVSTIYITAYGAMGGTTGYTGGGNTITTGGNGAEIYGAFSVTGGTQLSVLVGKQGAQVYNTQAGAGGGGGTYVWVTSNSTLLVAAGGGGGAALHCSSGCAGNGAGWDNGANGSTTQTPNPSLGPGISGSGGSGGSGGNGGSASSGDGAGGGAGWAGNGLAGGAGDGCEGLGGKDPSGGGAGGAAGCNNGTAGGYGGGGGGAGQGGGGGGGYNGGGGGNGFGAVISGGGGGGSYNAGTSQSNTVSSGTGDGMVVITY